MEKSQLLKFFKNLNNLSIILLLKMFERILRLFKYKLKYTLSLD